ncbi:hypothetical protein LTR08_001279 [Meristemomyces frigidus]|nr:hypothetical protein LTR08_001279 [Meristemomyces frigidus]
MVGFISGPTHQKGAAQAQAEAHHFAKVTWYKSPSLRKLYAYCMVVCLASATTGYDGSMLNGLQILPVWENYFNHPTGSILGLFGSIYSIGCLATLQGASTSFGMFVGARFLVGFGNTITQLSSPLLLTEICHPQHRSRVTAVYNCLWNLGAVVATWLTFGTFHIGSNWAWRIPSIVQAMPSVLQLCFLYWVPESPRWLMAKGKNEEALQMLAKHHADGNELDETVIFEYAEIKETIRLESEARHSSSYLDFFRTKGNRYRFFLLITLGLFSQWSGSGLVSYYFSKVMDSIGITDSTTQFVINGMLTIWSLLVSVSCASLVDRLGRRPLFLAATGGMLLMFTLWTICTAQYDLHGNKAAGSAVVAFIFLYSTCYAFAWNGLLTAYTVEILPYSIRAKGLMLVNFFVQVALVVNQYANPVGLEKLHPQYTFYVIYCCWLLFELVIVYFFYVETKGPTLEEVAKIFDGQDANVGVADVSEIKADLPEGAAAVHIEEILSKE